MSQTEIKIAYIGGGSRYWARDLMLDLAQSPHLKGAIDLYDIDQAAAVRNSLIGSGIFSRPDVSSAFTAHPRPSWEAQSAVSGMAMPSVSICLRARFHATPTLLHVPRFRHLRSRTAVTLPTGPLP